MFWIAHSIWRMRDLRHRPELTRLAGQLAAVSSMLAVAAVGGLGVDYLKAEVQLWSLILLTVLNVQYSMMHVVVEPEPASVPVAPGMQPVRWSG